MEALDCCRNSVLVFYHLILCPHNQTEVCVFLCFTDIHTEAVQAALAKHKEEKMALPMPTKRRSTYVPSPIETRTPPGRTQRASECKRLEVAGLNRSIVIQFFGKYSIGFFESVD